MARQINFLRRNIKVKKNHVVPQTEKVQLFYVVCTKQDREYFLVQGNVDASSLTWSKQRNTAMSWATGDAALEYINQIKNNNHPLDRVELKIIDEEVVDKHRLY